MYHTYAVCVSSSAGLLPLAYEARTSGLVAADAVFLPCRLRVWAFLAELRASGSALDGAELVPSYLAGVSLQPWLRFHEMKAYTSIDLPCSVYTPLSHEVRPVLCLLLRSYPILLVWSLLPSLLRFPLRLTDFVRPHILSIISHAPHR